MIKSRFIELMAKSISKSSTPEELAELEEFFIHFPEYRKMQAFTDALTTEEKEPDTLVKQSDINKKIDGLWDKIRIEESNGTPAKEAKMDSLIYWKWAAAVLLMGMLTVFFSTEGNQLLQISLQVQKCTGSMFLLGKPKMLNCLTVQKLN
ncbi:hypothetical protein [Pedobacter steynii]